MPTSDAGWSSLVARRAHNPKVVGSNPAPATNTTDGSEEWLSFTAIRPDRFSFALGFFMVVSFEAMDKIPARSL